MIYDEKNKSCIEPKPKFRKGDKVIYLNEEYVVEDITDHYILRSTRERTSVPVVHVGFGNEDYELRLVEEPVSDELEQEIDKYVNIPDNQGLPDLRRELSDCARHFANWQKKKDNQYFASKTIETLDNSYALGKKDMKEQMMKDAFKCKVKVDAGGYPYIPQMELYNYDKDIPLAKEGDKYNVILIKED